MPNMLGKGVATSVGKNLLIDTQDISAIDAPLTRDALNTMRSNVCNVLLYLCVSVPLHRICTHVFLLTFVVKVLG